MTLIESRQNFNPRNLGKLSHGSDPSPFDESGSEEEYLIANEGYPEDGENNNNRDFFSLPTLGLNYLNNLNLSLNLNLNLRNSSLWKIYENSSFTKPGFLSSYLGKHSDDLELTDHDITPDSRGFFTITNFLRRHGFQGFEEDYSEEAVLERIRFKKLQQQALIHAHNFEAENNLISELEFKEETSVFSKQSFFETSTQIDTVTDGHCDQPELTNQILTDDKICITDGNNKEMTCDTGVSNLCPFYSRVEVSIWDKIQIVFLTIFLLPIKLFGMAIALTLALMLSLIGMHGISFEESQSGQLSRWRRFIRWIIANVVMRFFVFSCGFIFSIKETGHRAEPSEASVFAVAPHSSYFDAFVVILLGAPSVVAKMSTKDIPIFGRLVTFTQPVYVARESGGSRRQALEVIKQRAQDVYHGSGMPQIFIFPEGTCSNRSSLIKFKQGAFVGQVPVQPVLIRYPNTLDTVTWTFDGPPILRNIWFALAQIYVKIEIEYLPIYVPNDKEKEDPNLYAENVRRLMARELQIPMSEYQFEDGPIFHALRESKLEQKLRSINRAKKALGLTGSARESSWISSRLQTKKFDMKFQKFQREFFNVTSEDTTVPEVQAVFSSFDLNDTGIVDIRPYLALTCIMYEDSSWRGEDITSKLLSLYDVSENQTPSADANLKILMNEFFEVPEQENSNKPLPVSSNTNQVVPDTPDEKHRIELWRRQLPRYIDVVKLYADEVGEKLPKTYPSRDERDKKPTSKSKSD